MKLLKKHCWVTDSRGRGQLFWYRVNCNRAICGKWMVVFLSFSNLSTHFFTIFAEKWWSNAMIAVCSPILSHFEMKTGGLFRKHEKVHHCLPAYNCQEYMQIRVAFLHINYEVICRYGLFICI